MSACTTGDLDVSIDEAEGGGAATSVFVPEQTPACRKRTIELMDIAPVGTPS